MSLQRFSSLFIPYAVLRPWEKGTVTKKHAFDTTEPDMNHDHWNVQTSRRPGVQIRHLRGCESQSSFLKDLESYLKIWALYNSKFFITHHFLYTGVRNIETTHMFVVWVNSAGASEEGLHRTGGEMWDLHRSPPIPHGSKWSLILLLVIYDSFIHCNILCRWSFRRRKPYTRVPILAQVKTLD